MLSLPAKYDFSAVNAVIVEPERGARTVLRTVLGSMGITNVTAVGASAEDVAKVETMMADVILVDASRDNHSGLDVIRQMRNSQIMKNPFAVTMVTVFEPSQELTREAALSGADGLMPKPLSNVQMKARIHQMIASRRPFQVTGTYIGPDIGKAAGVGTVASSTIEVPNTLRLKANGSWKSMDLNGEIGRVRSIITQERIRRDAFEIAWNLEVARLPGRIGLNFDALRRVPPLLEDLLRVVAPERRAATADLVAGLRTYIESARSREQDFILALPRLRAIALTLMALFSPGVDPNVLKQSVLDALPADEDFVGA